MIRIHLLKKRRKGVKVDPSLVANGMFQIGGQWNVLNLVANGMFQCLVTNGMFHCLVVNGR